jgi:endoglycosylceramidase
MVYKLAPYYPAAVGFGDNDAAFLARVGFNAVRVGVIWKALEPMPGVYDDSYLTRIADTVATLARHGIVSLLDFHQDMYNERFQGEGFPDWSIQDDGLPAQPQRGFNQNYFVMLALQHAFDHLWANSVGPGGIGLQDRYAAAWRHVALRFRANRSVLGYELMNEPFPGTAWPSCAVLTGCPAFDSMLTAFNRRVDTAIRSVDRRTLVWYEPNVAFDFGPATTVGPIGDPRAGFSFHAYCFEFGGSGTTNSCSMFGDLVLSNAINHVDQTGDALLMTEFGDDDYALLSAMVRRDDRNMVPWLEWSYCPCHDPTGAADKNAVIHDPANAPTDGNRNLPALRILVEAYPQLISGTPQSWAFDASTRTLRFRYTTARASGRGRFAAGSVTDIAAPRFVYGGRYAVSVTGGVILSRRDAGVLEIGACARARTITVTVTPRGRSRQSCRPGARAGPRRGSR